MRDEMDFVSEVFHAISQPLTALEVGLEISLRQDKDVDQLRSRVESALKIARRLHERLVELRTKTHAKSATEVAKVREFALGLEPSRKVCRRLKPTPGL